MMNRPAYFYIGVAVLLAIGFNDPAVAQPSSHAAVGSPAPDFSLTTLAGQQVRLSNFRGRPLIINFFASWCAPCLEEAPRVQRMAVEATSKGYSVLGIGFHDARAPLTQFMQNKGLTFPAALDVDSKVSRAYWLMGPPATFFISSDGIVRYRVTGPLTAADIQKGLVSVTDPPVKVVSGQSP